MKRTKFDVVSNEPYEKNAISFYSALLNRASLMSRMGQQYSGDRDIYRALGYPKDLNFSHFSAYYTRHDMAKAVVNRPIQATWRGTIRIEQAGIETVTEFEKTWNDLWKRTQLKSKLIRLDKLASLGRYGVLLLGFDDVRSQSDWSKPVSRSAKKLMYLKPLSEDSAKIASFDTQMNSERYGLPLIYDVSVGTSSDTSIYQQIKVHHSRVIHVPGELLESEVYGTPVLQAVYNRLFDLEKIVGGSAEMFWRGARPGFQAKIDPDFNMTDDMKEDLKNQIKEYEHNLRRFLANEGVEFQALQTQVSDPSKHVAVQLQMISAVTGIPVRILVGSERGELASSEDKSTWLELIQTRQQDYVEVQIIHPLIQKCVNYGILPDPGEEPYKVIWPDLFSPSEKERADIGKIRAAALQSYMNNPAAVIIWPPDLFCEFMLGLTDEEIEHAKKVYANAPNSAILKKLEEMKAQLGSTQKTEGRPPAEP